MFLEGTPTNARGAIVEMRDEVISILTFEEAPKAEEPILVTCSILEIFFKLLHCRKHDLGISLQSSNHWNSSFSECCLQSKLAEYSHNYLAM